MQLINHNVVWTAINSMKRIVREIDQGSSVEDQQLDELKAALSKCMEALENGSGKER